MKSGIIIIVLAVIGIVLVFTGASFYRNYQEDVVSVQTQYVSGVPAVYLCTRYGCQMYGFHSNENDLAREGTEMTDVEVIYQVGSTTIK